jgi:hypothetical protein
MVCATRRQFLPGKFSKKVAQSSIIVFKSGEGGRNFIQYLIQRIGVDRRSKAGGHTEIMVKE